MLKIKLARFGKKNQPHYRIIVNEARSKRDGQYVALLGHYAPTATPKILKLDLAEYAKWMEKGAQPTDTVASLAKRAESGNPFPEKAKRPSKKAVAKAKAAQEAKDAEAAAPKEEVAETPAEEVKA
jgi:small subunit ribosomal protein S16